MLCEKPITDAQAPTGFFIRSRNLALRRFDSGDKQGSGDDLGLLPPTETESL
jgi:hypothetical protein